MVVLVVLMGSVTFPLLSVCFDLKGKKRKVIVSKKGHILWVWLLYKIRCLLFDCMGLIGTLAWNCLTNKNQWQATSNDKKEKHLYFKPL